VNLNVIIAWRIISYKETKGVIRSL